MFKFNRPKFGKIRWKIKKKNEKEIPTGSYRRKFEVRELAICSRRWPFFYLFFFWWVPMETADGIDPRRRTARRRRNSHPPSLFSTNQSEVFCALFERLSVCFCGSEWSVRGWKGGGVPVRFLMKKGCVKPSNTNENPFEPSQT